MDNSTRTTLKLGLGAALAILGRGPTLLFIAIVVVATLGATIVSNDPLGTGDRGYSRAANMRR